jgi:hypothetical protein
MRPVPGTVKLAVRFELQSRAPSARHFTTVTGGDLGKWTYPEDPTLGRHPGDVWEPSHQVANLPAPREYRFRVIFRWIGATGRALARAVRVSRDCHQPELGPDLTAASLSIHPAGGDSVDYAYVAGIRNLGSAGAGPFDVQLSAAGQSQTREVKWLGRRSKLLALKFIAPACTAGAPVTVMVDPGHQIASDYNDANNVLTVMCPAAPPT